MMSRWQRCLCTGIVCMSPFLGLNGFAPSAQADQVGGSSLVGWYQQPVMMSTSSVVKAIAKYFGKQGAEEAAEYAAKKGTAEMAERVSQAALRQGGKEATEQVASLVSKHGPDALKALDNVADLKPVLAALDDVPADQVAAALTRLGSGAAGRELAETIAKTGSAALKAELKHPGVGGLLATKLGSEGAELATKLTSDQAIALARHGDDLVKLTASQRQGVLSLVKNDGQRMAAFMGRFVQQNPGKTLFTVAATTVILAEPERILGGGTIAYDADGNPVLLETTGLADRTLNLGADAVGQVTDRFLQPLFYVAMVFLVVFASAWMLMKLWHIHRRQSQLTQQALQSSAVVDAVSAKKKSADDSEAA
ncbi:hypothetical protein SV7mr_07400 [Stieleria bergensis]|uniref:Uncharacterized protein n=2 Tax=Stieleria bergensis TaxID=2528025 RepID=A0A517SQ47_9BACT|nr:hypothetical protein SV7mr_07400 [Planctomycetes bacterium SV_7m_r]